MNCQKNRRYSYYDHTGLCEYCNIKFITNIKRIRIKIYVDVVLIPRLVSLKTVSYTHLDVYKRQEHVRTEHDLDPFVVHITLNVFNSSMLVASYHLRQGHVLYKLRSKHTSMPNCSRRRPTVLDSPTLLWRYRKRPL